jgi:hypothetical protein
MGVPQFSSFFFGDSHGFSIWKPFS